jgi:hypothetical protein
VKMKGVRNNQMHWWDQSTRRRPHSECLPIAIRHYN